MTREFKLPLAILNDPAFSSDPRSHPNFPLANARSYKALPPKHPPSPSDSESTSPTVSSPVTSRSHSPTSPAPLLSPVSPVLPLSKKPKTPPLLVPEVLPRPNNADAVLKPVRINIPRKARMKAFVRRLTTRHNLDRIDELDETDPFGGSYHHDGPYEAISTTLAQTTLPCTHVPCRGNIRHPKRESDSQPSQSAYGGLSAYAKAGLSLHLEPGQILQQNAIYTSHASTIAGRFHPHSSAVPILTRPDPPRRQSLPNPRTRHCQDPSSLDHLDDFQGRQPSPLRAHTEHYAGDNAPRVSIRPLQHHPPYIHHQTEKTVFPPPRHESRFYIPGPSRSPQCIPSTTSLTTQSTENAGPTLPRHDSRHKIVHSLDSSRTIEHMFIPSSSGIQHKPLEPPRVRHLPKRLVMPAPLQPQPLYRYPPAELPTWQDEYADGHLEGVHFEGNPIIYGQEPRLLRKKSSAFPAKAPIPDHVLMSQDDTMPITRNSPTKTENETEGTKERTRRRRLSKRKTDV